MSYEMLSTDGEPLPLPLRPGHQRRAQLWNVGTFVLVGIVAVMAAMTHADSSRLWDSLRAEQERIDNLLADQLVQDAKLLAAAGGGGSPDAVGSAMLRTVVGGRSFAPQYYGQGSCSSADFLASIAKISVNPDGSSRNIPDDNTFDLADFDYSFDLPAGCPQPHVFTSAEACDLVDAFGGIFLRGDSIMRHISNALFMTLRNRREGAVQQDQDVCFGDRMFDDHKDCRKIALYDSQDKRLFAEPVCSNKTWLYFEQSPCPVQPSAYIPKYLDWRSQLPTNKSSLSTVIIQSFGLHCHMLPSITTFGVFKPLLTHAASAFPRPFLLWLGLSAPASNKPAEYLKTQGANQITKYNDEIRAILPRLQEERETLAQGKMAIMETYGLTDGAKSFDGTHYMWQINMEKAHLILNYLDLLWGETRALGGMWDLTELCPPGKWSYQCSLP